MPPIGTPDQPNTLCTDDDEDDTVADLKWSLSGADASKFDITGPRCHAHTLLQGSSPTMSLPETRRGQRV